MRRIGTLSDKAQAQRFADYLVTQSIDAVVDSDDPEGSCHLWVREERHVDAAREAFEAFQQSPDDSRFETSSQATEIREQRVEEVLRRQEEHRKRVRSTPPPRASLDRIGIEPLIGLPVKQRTIPLTITLIAVSVIISLTSNFARQGDFSGEPTLAQQTYLALSFVDRRDYVAEGSPYASLQRGQWWRLVTPMFMHGDEVHLVFNMLWLFFFGAAIERLHGSIFFLGLTLFTQIGGMLLQVSIPAIEMIPEPLHGSPFAIGASGAVYGLFGYLWVRPLVDFRYPIYLVHLNVVLMLGWLVICMTPLVENVANGAHLGGLLSGGLFAIAAWIVQRK